MKPENIAEGLAVDVLIWNNPKGRADWTGRGIVTAIYTADDRPYRLNVKGTGPFMGRSWKGCAPECVRPAGRHVGQG